MLRTQPCGGTAPVGTRDALLGHKQHPTSPYKQGTPPAPRRRSGAPRVPLVTREELAKQKPGIPPRGAARRRVRSAHSWKIQSTGRWTQAARPSTLWARRQSAPTDLKRMCRFDGSFRLVYLARIRFSMSWTFRLLQSAIKGRNLLIRRSWYKPCAGTRPFGICNKNTFSSAGRLERLNGIPYGVLWRGQPVRDYLRRMMQKSVECSP